VYTGMDEVCTAQQCPLASRSDPSCAVVRFCRICLAWRDLFGFLRLPRIKLFFSSILDIFFAGVLDEAVVSYLSSHTQGLSTMDDSRKPHAWLHSLFRKSKASEAGASPDERSSLLPPAQHEEWSAGETYELEEGAATGFQLVAREFWVLLKGSIPVIVAYALQNSLQTISVLIVGRLSPEALATAAFSYMFAMATGWLIALGGTTAIDTLASASFTGSKDRHDLGIILQRSFIVLSLFYVPVAILWFCSAPLFRALGQEEYIARDSARFLSVLAPGGLGYIFFEAMKKYLQAQGMFFLFFRVGVTR
jgi:hypothetical protein